MKNQETVHVPVRSIDSIIPAPENDEIYRAIAWDDPEILALARSIKERGVEEPILVSRDGYIISGHRRRIAGCRDRVTYLASRGKSCTSWLRRVLVSPQSSRAFSSILVFSSSLVSRWNRRVFRNGVSPKCRLRNKCRSLFLALRAQKLADRLLDDLFDGEPRRFARLR